MGHEIQGFAGKQGTLPSALSSGGGEASAASGISTSAGRETGGEQIGAQGVLDVEAQDQQAKGLLMLHVEDALMYQIDECATTKEAWEKLAKLHAGNSMARRAALARDWATLQQGPREGVQAFVQRVRTLATAMKSAGDEQGDERITLAVLNGLSPTFSVLREVWLVDDEGVTLDRMLPALLRREQEAGGLTPGGGN